MLIWKKKKKFRQLNKNITTFNLSYIAAKLRETAANISDAVVDPDVRTTLRNQALHLDTYQENLVNPMTEQTVEVMELTLKLDETFKFNQSSFEKGIESILTEIEEAKNYISLNATEFVKGVSVERLKFRWQKSS